MNWSYVAGFFDGEGCIYWMGRKGVMRPVLVVGQAESNQQPIRVLSDFLASHKIQHKMYWQDRSAISNAQRFLRINIHEHRAVAAALHGMLPHLILKSDKATAALAFIEGRRWQRRFDESEYRAAHALYASGMSSRDVSAKSGISPRALRSHWSRLSLPIRSQRQAAGMWRGLKASRASLGNCAS